MRRSGPAARLWYGRFSAIGKFLGRPRTDGLRPTVAHPTDAIRIEVGVASIIGRCERNAYSNIGKVLRYFRLPTSTPPLARKQSALRSIREVVQRPRRSLNELTLARLIPLTSDCLDRTFDIAVGFVQKAAGIQYS